MKRLVFQGYSDDTFACTGRGIDVDFDTCASGKPVYMRVQSGGDALVVCGQYAPGHASGWLIGIAPARFDREECHIASWPIRIERSDREYSPLLVIDAPDDVTVELLT